MQRGHGGATPLDAIKLIVDHGFILNVDLMYGLPGQTEASFRRDFQRVVEAGVHSVTAYDLRVTRSTPVVQRLRGDEWLSIQRLHALASVYHGNRRGVRIFADPLAHVSAA